VEPDLYAGIVPCDVHPLLRGLACRLRAKAVAGDR